MGEVLRARVRLAAAGAGVLLLVAAGLMVGWLADDQPDHRRAGPAGVAAGPAAEPKSGAVAVKTAAAPGVWQRPSMRDPAGFARAFATAIWTYDTRLPYAAWAEGIGGWADPLGSPASARVAVSMLPPAPAYAGLRAQGAVATAAVESVVVPEAAAELVGRAPAGWQVFVVRGSQHVTTSTGTYDAVRQASVAVVCDPVCWLYSATPELPR